jgi:hypothetical protein
LVHSSAHSLRQFLVCPRAAEVALVGVEGDVELIAEAEDPRHVQEGLESNSELAMFELAKRIAAEPGTVGYLLGREAKKFAPRDQLLADCARSPLRLRMRANE